MGCRRGRNRVASVCGGLRDAAERFVRPDSRALRVVQRRFREILESEDRANRKDQPVARGLRPSGALGHRRFARRCSHARTRRGYRQHRPASEACSHQLGEPPAEQQRAVYVHHRVPRAERQPEESQRLGRSREARHCGHHAESAHVRRRALELSRRVGVGHAPLSAASAMCCWRGRTKRCSP
jgi:hypothetical protein